YMYCSRVCSQRASHERQQHERALMTAGEREAAKKLRQQARKEAFAADRTFTCAWCGGVSTWKPMANPRTYCSRSCAAHGRHAARKANGAVPSLDETCQQGIVYPNEDTHPDRTAKPDRRIQA